MKLHFADKLELPSSIVTSKVAVIAESGAGKTYTAGVLAEQMLGVGAQVIIFDPVGVWWGLQSAADGKSAGFPILVMGGDRANLPLTPESGELVGRLLAERGVSAVLDVSGFITSETKRFVRDFAEAFFQAKKKNKTPVHLIFEEAQTFAPQFPEKDEGVMLNRVERLLKIGRNYGVGWTLVTQQPQSVAKKILNLTITLVLLRTSGPQERKALALWAQSNADSKMVDLIGDLPGFETGEAHVWSPSVLKVSKRVRIAKKTTFDSSATPEVGHVVHEPKVLAPVEIEQLRAAMETVVVEAEKEDPKALQKRVAELERQLAAKPTVETKTVTVEKQVSIKAELEQLVRDLETAKNVSGAVVLAQQRIAENIEKIGRVLDKVAHPLVHVPATLSLSPGPLVELQQQLRKPLKPQKKDGAMRTIASQLGLKGPALDMLRELAAHHPASMTRRELATRCGLKHGNGNFRNLVSSLRVAGYVLDDAAGDLQATDAGVAAVGKGKLRGPLEAVALWTPKLKTKARTMLQLLLAHPGDSFTREQLAEAAQLEPGNGNFRNLLSSLTSAGLAEKSGRGFTAGHALFIGALQSAA